jgi:hypothetical protein
MKRLITNLLVIGALGMGVTTFLSGKPVSAAEEHQTVLQADHALIEALGKADQKAVSALLDEGFEWTDVEGKTQNKKEALQNLAALAKDSEGDTDVKFHSYGQLDIVFGFHHGARFSRIWIKRSPGWRVFIYLNTPVPKTAAVAAPGMGTPGSTADCDNPCRTLPFTPKTEADQAVLAEWQKTKVDEWHPNAADWPTHVADDFLMINDRSERTKAERVVVAKKQQEAGASAPGDPVLSMSMSDFGDAVVMISRHWPYRGGKPYYNARVFIHVDGHWPIAWSQQTTIQDAPLIPAVTDQK